MSRIARPLVSLLVVLTSAGCSTTHTTKATVEVEVASTSQSFDRLRRGHVDYKGPDELIAFYLSQPQPRPNIKNIVVGNIPPGNDNIYDALLAFIHAGPGGSAITVEHLKQITQPALAVVAILPNITSVNQLLATPQAINFLAVAQSILQPLGLWNQTTLNAWISYVQPQVNTALNILLDLQAALAALGVLPDPQTIQVTETVNVIEIWNRINELWKAKEWLTLAEVGPGLVHRAIKHLGYTKPMIFIFGSRSNYYRPSILTERVVDGERETVSLNESGFLPNYGATGAQRWYQGPDDNSLIYIPVEVKGGRVTSLDALPSDKFVALKKGWGGNVDLIDRVSTHSTGFIRFDMSVLNDETHLRVLWANTPLATMAGIGGETGIKSDYFDARIGGGSMIDHALDSSIESVIGFLDVEATIRSPKLEIKNKEKTNSAAGWLSASASISGLADKQVSDTDYKGRKLTGGWGFQGDCRLVPEAHFTVSTKWLQLNIYGGNTFAVVPGGTAYLDNPAKSVSLYPIRYHIAAEIGLNLGEMINASSREEAARGSEKGVKPWWTEKERLDYLASRPSPEADLPVKIPMWIRLAGVGEFSEFADRGRIGGYLDFVFARVGIVGEVETDKVSPIKEVSLGVEARYMSAYVIFLQSIDVDAYRIEFGADLIDLFR